MHSIISALARIKCFLYSYNTIWMYSLSHLSDLRKLTENGYLKEISLNGRTKGYIRSFNFEEMISKVR